MYDLKTGIHLSTIQKQLQALSSTDIYQKFVLSDQDILIKTTISLCDQCKTYTPACVLNMANKY